VGGPYVTPRLAGSRPGGAAAAAWAVMQYFGQEGYARLHGALRRTTERSMRGVEAAGFRVLGAPPMLRVRATRPRRGRQRGRGPAPRAGVGRPPPADGSPVAAPPRDAAARAGLRRLPVRPGGRDGGGAGERRALGEDVELHGVSARRAGRPPRAAPALKVRQLDDRVAAALEARARKLPTLLVPPA
jgi:hypothetical protein